jgi:hypothetical protein
MITAAVTGSSSKLTQQDLAVVLAWCVHRWV